MLRIDKDNGIYLTRGDTAYIQVPIINDLTSEEYVLQPDDTLTLSVKRNINDEVCCFKKELVGTNIFHIRPEDTRDCSFSAYKYDVQLTTANGDVFTVIEPSLFKVCAEVT